MATLFALDRAEVADELAELSADGYVVLLDRFTASNAAYSAARLAEDVDGPTVEWVRMLETGSLGVPVPDLQVLVDVEVDEAARRVTSRAADDPARVPDAYEADAALQQRTAEAYRALAAAAWGSPWEVVTNPRPRTATPSRRGPGTSSTSSSPGGARRRTPTPTPTPTPAPTTRTPAPTPTTDHPRRPAPHPAPPDRAAGGGPAGCPHRAATC